MRTFRVALAQVNPTVGDIEGNARLVLDYVERARDEKADLVCFPELVIAGYPPEDLLLKPSFIRANQHAMQKVASQVQGIAAVVGYAHMDTDLHNAAAVCADGEVRGVYRKHFLPTYGVFDEDRYFRPGREAPIFVVAGTSFGVCVCEDIWYPSGPAEWLSWAGAEVVVNINGSPFHAGKLEARRTMLATRASDYVVALAYVNMIGGQDELVFDGGSMVLDAEGELVASAPQFVEELLIADVDVDAVARERLHDPRGRKVSGPPSGVTAVRTVISGEQASVRTRAEPPLAPSVSVEEEIYEALVLGVRDYVRKSGFREVFIGISGGIDSALTAVVAVDALGAGQVTGVLLSSRYSSEHSRADALEVARRLGIRTIDLPIASAHDAVEAALEPHIKGTPGEGVARENVQSRIRGLYLMALSNATPASLVLTTGNKSELATGYATLYGDMAGGFSVLKDVYKTTVYRIAAFRNARGEVIPASVMSKPPSAELRPDQKDTDSLPPYEILDPILRAYVEEDRGPDEIEGDRETIRRVIQMVDRNEYRRRQAPPGVKVTPRAFGRDRRLPITNRYRDD